MKFRILIIVIFFLACLAGLVLLKNKIWPARAIHRVDMFDSGKDWSGFLLENAVLSSDSDRVIIESQSGTIRSPIVKTRFPFDEMVITWNCIADTQSGLAIALAVGDDTTKMHRFLYQRWGELPESVPDEFAFGVGDSVSGVGRIDVDIAKLKKSCRYYRFEVLAYSNSPMPFMLDRVSVCYSNTKAGPMLAAKFAVQAMPIKPVALAVPFFAQGSLPDSISSRTCSPTSLTMVLNYHGLFCSPMEVSGAVYDREHDIYGNWPYNIQAAYALGISKTWLGRHGSFGELYDEIAKGCPVIISIDVPPGKLRGAPYKSTGGGHLIVVRGFDEAGNVLVNDPAGDEPAEGMVAYDIGELTEVWVDHGGVAYHLWPKL